LGTRRLDVRGLTITTRDARGFLAIDLRDLLPILETKGLESTWRLNGVEAVDGDAAVAMHEISDTGALVSGERLLELANGVSQVIDGEFSAYLAASSEPWIRIRAIDSDAYEVVTKDLESYRKIKERFPDASEVFAFDEE
jgi:hypothetical protein